MPLQLLKGRSTFKQFVASTSFSAESLPYRNSFLSYLREQKTSGRRIVLATASHRTVAQQVAHHLDLFEGVLATDDGGANLKGRNKLAAIRQTMGENFTYAGDSVADIPIWKAAHSAILVGASPSVVRRVRAFGTPVEAEFPAERASFRVWVKALRIHQWSKNLLVFLPLLTAFSFLQSDKPVAAVLAFFAFSLTASATYLVNDLWDLDNDRAHPRKRNRPIASGQIPVTHALAMSGTFLSLGIFLGLAVSWDFFLMLALYLSMTGTYSCLLKRYVLMDVLTLSLLYTLRILAGAVAIAAPVSTWLIAFSLFIFFSLALVKRCSELVTLRETGITATRGRDYRVHDLAVLWPLGVASAMAAVVVFGLFINAAETVARYANPQFLWLMGVGLIYWLSRLWIKAGRGEMDDDPVVYAVKDRGSRTTILGMVMVMLLAYFLDARTLINVL